MKVRHPPGRAGRPWLVRRLAVAERGAELLDEKQRALGQEQARLLPLVAAARERWAEVSGEAEAALARAVVLGGERDLLNAAAASPEPAEVTIRWQTILGVTCPAEGRVARPAVAPPTGGAALAAAAEAHRRALEAAVDVAVAERALALVEADLRATALRRNAIRHRWIPAHEEALAALSATLEELEREDGARVRSIVREDGRQPDRG